MTVAASMREHVRCLGDVCGSVEGVGRLRWREDHDVGCWRLIALGGDHGGAGIEGRRA
jgi:hypothetical protein